MADVVHERRPIAGGMGEMAIVENDDIAHAVVRFRNGARGVLSSSRIAHGRKNGLRVEVHGSKGMLWLDNERMNELNLYVAEGSGAQRGFRRILSSPAHPAYGMLCPAPGHGLGFNELKVIELAEILHAVAGLPSNHVDFTRGLGIEKTIHAFARSSSAQAWVNIE
jgi:predicted dehydrogenase